MHTRWWPCSPSQPFELRTFACTLTVLARTVSQDVLLHYGATKYGGGPIALGQRSPRQSYNPAAPDFLRERGSYQNPLEHP